MKQHDEPAIKRMLTLMVQLQTRRMSTKQMADELLITERTAFRYLKLFREIGVELNRSKFGQYTFQKVPDKKRPAKRIKQKMNDPNSNHFSDVGNMVNRRPVKMIFHRFQFNEDFAKWMAEHKQQLLESERQMLAEFARFVTDSDMNIEQTVDLFLNHYENN